MASDLDAARARLLYRAECLEVMADSSYLILDGPDAEVPEQAGYAVSRNAHAGREAMDIRALLDSWRQQQADMRELAEWRAGRMADSRVERLKAELAEARDNQSELMRKVASVAVRAEKAEAELAALNEALHSNCTLTEDHPTVKLVGDLQAELAEAKKENERLNRERVRALSDLHDSEGAVARLTAEVASAKALWISAEEDFAKQRDRAEQAEAALAAANERAESAERHHVEHHSECTGGSPWLR